MRAIAALLVVSAPGVADAWCEGQVSSTGELTLVARGGGVLVERLVPDGCRLYAVGHGQWIPMVREPRPPPVLIRYRPIRALQPGVLYQIVGVEGGERTRLGQVVAGAAGDQHAPRWLDPPRVRWSHLRVGCMSATARFELDLHVADDSPVRIEVVARPVDVDGETMKAVTTPDDGSIEWRSGGGFLQAGEAYVATVCAEDAAGNRACAAEPMRFTAPVAVPLDQDQPEELISEPPPPDEQLRPVTLSRSRIDWLCAAAGAAGAAVVLLIAGLVALRRVARRRISRAA